STSSAVRASLIPARDNSSRIGITMISGYMCFVPPAWTRSPALLLYEVSHQRARGLVYLEVNAGSRTGISRSIYDIWHWGPSPLVCGSVDGTGHVGRGSVLPR